MIRLFLFFPLLLLSQEVFTLPQEANHFTSVYSRDLIQAKNSVYIFCKDVDEYSFISALKKLSKRDIPITLITTDTEEKLKKISYLDLLKGVKVFTLNTHEQRKIKGSLSCIDDTILYLTSDNLEYTAFKQNYSFVLKQETRCESIFTDLIKLSTQRQ